MFVLAVVPVKLDKRTIKLIDALVDIGMFRSRNEAIRELIKSGMGAIYEPIFNARIVEIVSEMLNFKDAVEITAKEEAWKIVSKERERF